MSDASRDSLEYDSDIICDDDDDELSCNSRSKYSHENIDDENEENSTFNQKYRKNNESAKRSSFSIDNILGLEKKTKTNEIDRKNVFFDENNKIFIRPIPLIAASNEINPLSIEQSNQLHLELSRNKFHYHSPVLVSHSGSPTSSSIYNQNAGFSYANWIEMQNKTNISHGNFIFGYQGL